MACQDCLDLVLNVDKFALRCAKVSKMFWELSSGKFSEGKGDLVRQIYGLSESEDFSSVARVKAEEVEEQISKLKYLEIELVDQSEHVESDVDCTGSVKNDEIYIEDSTGFDNVDIMEQMENSDVFSDGQYEEETPVSDQESVRIEMLDEAFDQTDIEYKEGPKRRSYNKKTISGLACLLCDMKFIGHKWYEKHMKTKHTPNGPVDFACSKCPKRFAYRYRLKEHENVHLPNDVRMIYKCQECEKIYKSHACLKAHTKFVHTRERLCVCEECGKAFADVSTLRTHKIVHAQERPSQCTLCPKSFKDSTHLKKHLEIHTADTHECPVCGRQFNTKRSVNSHMFVHSDQKMYKCHLCKFAFKRGYALKVNICWNGVKKAALIVFFIIFTETFDSTLRSAAMPVFLLR